MKRILKESGYDNVIRRQKKITDWDSEDRLNINPEEAIKKAFTQMTNKQLEFHLQIGGKNKVYAQALLNHRKKK